MKEQALNKTIHSLLLLFIAFLCNAQQITVVRASVDKKNVLIGEQINLVLEADIPESQPISFFTVDSIAHFEFLLRGKIDTVNTSKGTSLKQLFRLTSFDSGQWVIPAYTLAQSENIRTDSIVINVGFLPFDSTKDYNDIKEIMEVDAEKKTGLDIYPVGSRPVVTGDIYLPAHPEKEKAGHSAGCCTHSCRSFP